MEYGLRLRVAVAVCKKDARLCVRLNLCSGERSKGSSFLCFYEQK